MQNRKNSINNAFHKVFCRTYPLENSPRTRFLNLVACDKTEPYETCSLIHYKNISKIARTFGDIRKIFENIVVKSKLFEKIFKIAKRIDIFFFEVNFRNALQCSGDFRNV